MATFKNTSWGRTRGPKNLAGDPGTAITALANTNDLKGITATSAGYATENQRYLHVLVEETNDGSDTNATATTIFGYCHAFQRWFEISAVQELSALAPEGEEVNVGTTAASVDPPNSSTTPANHVPSAREYRVYQIVGIDRVAFVNANAARVNIFAACSTF